MADAEGRAVRKLEKQIAKTQQRLAKMQGRTGPRGRFLGGIALGTVAGGLLTYYLTQSNDDAAWAQEHGDDAIVLREQPTPTGQTAEVKPLPELNVTADREGTDEVAATELESPEAVGEIEQRADDNTRPASLVQPQQAATPNQTQTRDIVEPATTERTIEAGPPAGAGQPTDEGPRARSEQPASAAPMEEHDAPLAVGIGRPEIVLAKASGNSDEVLAEATSDEPTPAPAAPVSEPIDGVCPADRPIKGNRGSMGAMIYHVPGGRNYDRTKPEACFATVEEAEAAGYRAPRG
jgi:hypothetical protein